MNFSDPAITEAEIKYKLYNLHIYNGKDMNYVLARVNERDRKKKLIKELNLYDYKKILNLERKRTKVKYQIKQNRKKRRLSIDINHYIDITKPKMWKDS